VERLRHRTKSGEPRAQFPPESGMAEELWYQCLRSAGLFDLLAPLLSVLFSGMPAGEARPTDT